MLEARGADIREYLQKFDGLEALAIDLRSVETLDYDLASALSYYDYGPFYLSVGRLSDREINNLTLLRGLTYLDVRGAGASDKVLDEVRRRLPAVTIIRDDAARAQLLNSESGEWLKRLPNL
jgi:hypothetical protein